MIDILHIKPGDVEMRAEGQQRPRNPIRIKNRDEAGFVGQALQRRGGERVGERLVGHVAAPKIVEGFDVQHVLESQPAPHLLARFSRVVHGLRIP